MCGLSGEYTFDGRHADLAAVAQMCDAMVARGPDDYGAFAHGPLAFGHRRLSIIDLTSHGHQPMVDSELGLTIAFNGCIYNYKELREDLARAGYRFFSTSDTEVVAKAYHRWGANFVDHFQGMFAVAIHERDTGRLILARDRLGIKPLYVTENSRRIRFASSLPALVRAGGVDTDIDPVALHHYLSWHAVVPAPHTILKGVRKLPPATVRTIEPDGTSHDHTYWDLTAVRDPQKAGWSETDWEEAILESLRVAVRRRLVADVPVGVLLSGGLDSSLVVGLLAEEGQHGINTFSIGFEAVGGEEGDEFKYSDVVAREFGTEHHQIRIPTERMLPALDDAIRAMSEPMVSHDAVAFFLLSEEVSKHVKVVQSGQGADEVFAGYHWYPPLLGAGRDDAVDVYTRAFFDRDHAGMRDVVRPEHRAGSPVSLEFVEEHMKRPGAETAVDAALRLDTQIMLVDDPVKRVDNMTMAWGLEARVPFLDHELVELAAQCPPELKLAQEGKGVLKEAGRRVLPNEVIDRPKGYFPVPALKYLQGPYLERVRDALHAPAARERGLFNETYVNYLLDNPNSELTPLRGNRLWQLGLLEMWLQTHLPENR
ncbi:N-acetylglutaminylglutamine amidotransferase [Actinobacteria bacterium YIM 96077]|uniref:asparagine synthase (glutamine-hydrolyzing) n=1 Tax=Phytoactinopolyspora halophila TaxID=1981511 RepID=A0A329QGX6_9ACTN|nr:N-acetylglutaminylglutamine amidotransferase [Phytoactinopolyspora halophila]AYY13657.1 N-acetylglutaminylglutamine amidotransferase [Actinobacteria bacterium YIM 96077]RAW11221.1 N-acetylglutaminylglutamine amidotransferase [Phytoactinopolyspora halophila]